MGTDYREFKVGELELKIRKPNIDELREAQKVQTRAFHDALDNGAILRVKLDDVLESQGLWDKKKEMELKTLQAEIADLEVRLLKGGMKLSEGEKVAFEMIDKREKIKDIVSNKLIYDSRTAESMSEDARTDYLLSVCLVYNNKENTPYFKDLADYLNQQDGPVAIQAYREYLMLMNNSDENPEKNLTEYKFLRKYNKVDDKLRLINKDGHLVDREGRLINEDGRYVDKDGNLVDINGNPVDELGNYKFDTQPFLDEEGKPIEV